MGVRIFVAAAGVLAALTLAGPAAAAPGQPDLTFGFDGLRTVDFGGDDVANAVAVQPNGKVVLAGYSIVGGNQNVAIARLTARGVPDTSFSGDGRFTYEPAAGTIEFANAVAAQPDGKIVFAGHTSAGGSLADVGRLADDGSFDGSFDGDGHRGYEWGGTDVATSVAVRPNGKIVIAGYTDAFGGDIVVQQANADGSPDPSFGGGGGARRIVRGGAQVTGALALQRDGKVVVAGTTWGAAGSDIVVTRLTANGAPDPSFARSGSVVVNLPGDQFGPSVRVAPDGRIVVAGSSKVGAADQDFLLLRFNAGGTLDRSFATGGRSVLDPVGLVDLGHSAVVQPDGKVAFVGTVFAADGDIAGFAEVERVTASGRWDPTFHTDGHVGFHFAAGMSAGRALALQWDGKLVVAGFTTANQDFGAARLEGGPFPPRQRSLPGPPADSDGDGVPDPSDRCPSVPGGRFDSNRDGCPGPYARIRFGLVGGWDVLRSGIRMASETVTRVPVGATVRLRCKSCRIRQTIRARSSRVRLKKLRGKLLRRGKSFSVRVTAPGRIGQVKTLKVKRYGKSRRARRRVAADPFKTVQRCIPIGATKPARSCSATPPAGP
jgi:uncharacterized delta-60 repeat protein